MKGVVIAGTGSNVGKTSITTGILSLLSKDYKVQAFKAGPDFIDPMYHTIASGRDCRNLDSFMMDEDTIRNVVGHASKGADLCIVEGVRGLYEGFSAESDIGSTAGLAKLLGFPVILTIDVRSLNKSAAAIINGFADFDPDVRIEGVILNNISGKQHEDKLDEVMDFFCKQKVVGKIRRLRDSPAKRRQAGLITPDSDWDTSPFEEIAENVDLNMLMDIAESSDVDLPDDPPYVERNASMTAAVPLDDAFCFYYKENLECLEASGIEVKHFSPVAGDPLPDADMYYLGGGYPELFAKEISSNKDFLEGMKNASVEGKPILGECGGLLTMCGNLRDIDGTVHEMTGIFDAESAMTDNRHGPTYVLATPNENNPLFDSPVRAHEYHYSEVYPKKDSVYCYDLSRGAGIIDSKDGLVIDSSVGTYMHQNALSQKDWARGFVSACK